MTALSAIFCCRVRLFQIWVYEEFSRVTRRTNESSTRAAVNVPPPEARNCVISILTEAQYEEAPAFGIKGDHGIVALGT
jgi:hypothetical protein